jgi:anti-sigma-K factor RskA
MPLDANHCPPDPGELAEQYLLGMLLPEEVRTFEDHYLTCADCAAVVEKADAYVRAMRAAGRDFQT